MPIGASNRWITGLKLGEQAAMMPMNISAQVDAEILEPMANESTAEAH